MRWHSLGQPGLGPAPHDPRPPNRAWARRIPPGFGEGSQREGVREPEAGPRGGQSPVGEAAGRVDAHLRGGDRAGLEPAAAGLALSLACRALAGEPGAPCLPPHREDAGLGGYERRRDRHSRSDLAREGGATVPEAAPAHPCGHGVGSGDGASGRQPLRPDRARARSAGGACSAHAGVAARRGGGRDRDGAGVERAAGREAGLRVPGADGGTLRRGPRGALDGDRPGRGCVDHPGPTHEGEPRAPGPALLSRSGDPRGSADARSRQPARVSGRTPKATGEHGAVGTARGVEGRGRAARLPVEPFATGRPRRRSIHAKWRRRRLHTRSATRSRPPIGARTCSTADAGSWTTGLRIWPGEVGSDCFILFIPQ